MKLKFGCLEFLYRMAGETPNITLPYLDLNDAYHEHELMIPHGGCPKCMYSPITGPGRRLSRS
jgi:hypothetical protein